MVTMTADVAAFRAGIKRAIAGGAAARRGAIVELARAFGTEVLRRSPVDTGRFKRAEAQALNAAGVGPFPEEAIKSGNDKLRRRIQARLTVQVRFWEKVARGMEARGEATYKTKRGTGQTKHYRDALKKAELSRRYLAEFVASEGTAAVIASEWWQRVSEAKRRKTPIDPTRILTRAYSKVYGGTGRIIEAGSRSIVQLVNKEPHAYIVEARYGPRKTALNAVGNGLVKRVGNGYVKRVAAAAGVAARI